MQAGQKRCEGRTMTNGMAMNFVICILFTGIASAQEQPQSATPLKVQTSPPAKDSKQPTKDSSVPSPEKYQFTEALKRLQSQDVPKPTRSTTVPPLTVVPMPTPGPRSKDVPRDYAPKKDVALGQTGQDAVSVSRQWQEA